MAERLIAARAEIPAIRRSATAKIQTKSGGSFSYAYATLEDVLAAAVPALAKHGLALTQPLVARDDGGVIVATEVRDPAGQTLRAEVPVPPQGDPQRLGAWVTYARRYTLAALLAIATDEDGDAAGVAQPAARTAPADGKTKAPDDDGDSSETISWVGIVNVELAREGTKKDGTPWKMWTLELSDGRKVTTFSSTVADTASNLIGSGKLVDIELVHRGRYTNAARIQVVGDDDGVPF